MGPGRRSIAALSVLASGFLSMALLASQTDAAMALRITVDPAEPIAGLTTRVSVRTLAPFSQHCVNDPAADMRPWWDWSGNGGRDLFFDLKAFQDDRAIDIALTRRESDLTYWDGRVVFPTSGTWTLRMVRPKWGGGGPAGEECAGARTTVFVREARMPASSTDPLDDATTAALVGALVAAGAVLLLAMGSRAARQRSDQR